MVRNVVPVFDMILFDEKGWGYFILNFNTNVNCYNKTFYDYVIIFVNDLRQVGSFPWFPPPIKLTATK
jgi:hypothetical protein